MNESEIITQQHAGNDQHKSYVFARTICMFVYDNDNNNHNYVRKNNQNDNQNHLNKIKEKLYDPKHYFATSSSQVTVLKPGSQSKKKAKIRKKDLLNKVFKKNK